MNLIDAHVTKVISKREVEAKKIWHLSPCDNRYGMKYIVFEVEYKDIGGKGIKELWYDESIVPDVKEGFDFQH